MNRDRKYCVYIYLDENGVPYYIGEGWIIFGKTQDLNRGRPYSKHDNTIVPTDRNKIIIVKVFATKKEAVAFQDKLIKDYGRRGLDEGGILDNKCFGKSTQRNPIWE
jgi:hypothetical protein